MTKKHHIRLRQVMNSDLALFTNWFNDPEVTQFLTQYLPISEFEEQKWIEDLPKRKQSDVVFVVEHVGKRRPKPIGSCGLHKINWKDRTAEITMVIGEKEYWGKGFGSVATVLLVEYAFKQLGLHRLYTGIYSFNKRSIAALKKNKFTQEGCQRQAVFKNGEYFDILLFGLLKTEW